VRGKIIFLVITALAIFVRFYNFESLINFHLDPPFYLHEVKDMVDSGKLRLVGPQFTSKVVMGRGIFLEPHFYYLLAAAGIATNWSVQAITAIFTIIWIATFVIIYFFIRRKFGEINALIIYALFSFMPYFVQNSRFIWNPYVMPFFGVIFFWFLAERKQRKTNYFWAGLFYGLALSFHYSAVLWLPILLYLFVRELRKRKFKAAEWAALGLGAIIALSPLLIFELKHDFYNFRTIIFQIQNYSPSAGYTFNLSYYYILPGIPLATYALGYLLHRFRGLSIPLIIIAGVFLIQSIYGSGQTPTYPQGWSIAKQKQVADLIIKDGEKDFEVAETINSDTRAMDIRWWLRMRGVKVLPVDAYNRANVLYLVAPYTRPPETESVWEVASITPFSIKAKADLGENIVFYKLVRKNSN
jgi:4-amino-4-deoxy-L-arabinose transferase-like glycosyltransferase